MTEPRNPSPYRATGESGVTGSRRAGEPSGSSVPEVDVPEQPAPSDPTTSTLTEMVTDTGESRPPTEVEPVTNSGPAPRS
jgi:hypothetical protein